MSIKTEKHCHVIFKGDLDKENPKMYTYLSNNLELQKGEEILVETNKGQSEGTAIFQHYVPEQFVTSNVMSKVLRKAPANTARTFTGVKTGGRVVRSKEQREHEAKKLRALLLRNHPMMVSTRDISAIMGWNAESASNFIKHAMTLEPKIIQVYKGWYTTKL